MKILHEKFTALDGIAIVTVFLFLFWNIKVYSIIPEEMYMSMGKELPISTHVVYSIWYKIMAIIIPLIVLGLLFNTKVKKSIFWIRWVIIGSFILASTIFSITVMGIYQPMFDMASGI